MVDAKRRPRRRMRGDKERILPSLCFLEEAKEKADLRAGR